MSHEKIYAALASAINDNREKTRRRFPRRGLDTCIASVNGTNYPVRDWSQCGVLFDADGKNFEKGSTCDVVMKFKLSDVVTEIPVKANIIRAGKKQVALEFYGLSKKVEQAFAKVIEDARAQKSAEREA